MVGIVGHRNDLVLQQSDEFPQPRIARRERYGTDQRQPVAADGAADGDVFVADRRRAGIGGIGAGANLFYRVDAATGRRTRVLAPDSRVGRAFRPEAKPCER